MPTACTVTGVVHSVQTYSSKGSTVRRLLVSREFAIGECLVSMEIFEPRKKEDGLWRCDLRIANHRKELENLRIDGLDKLDAILNALKLLKINLLYLQESADGELSWVGGLGTGISVDISDDN